MLIFNIPTIIFFFRKATYNGSAINTTETLVKNLSTTMRYNTIQDWTFDVLISLDMNFWTFEIEKRLKSFLLLLVTNDLPFGGRQNLTFNENCRV